MRKGRGLGPPPHQFPKRRGEQYGVFEQIRRLDAALVDHHADERWAVRLFRLSQGGAEAGLIVGGDTPDATTRRDGGEIGRLTAAVGWPPVLA